MPEYLSPGVYVDEVPDGSRPIPGVDTSTAGLVGSVVAGPHGPVVGPLASPADFDHVFGAGGRLDDPANALRTAACLYFGEGGTRLWVVGVDGASPDDYRTALERLEAVPHLAMVAAPGANVPIARFVVHHAERTRRLAVLDVPDGLDVAAACAWAADLTSAHAATYLPWIDVLEPVAQRRMRVPPSAAVAGVLARLDRERGLHAEPAAERVTSAIGVALEIDDGVAETLRRAGITPLRSRPEGGVHVGGDPAWTSVRLRRLLLFLEASLYRGLQWVEFEPNGEPLWGKVRTAVTAFLDAQWRLGILVGTRPADAFFVRCDPTTMTEGDLASGRLVCLLGVAVARPGDFVTFRLTRSTQPPPA